MEGNQAETLTNPTVETTPKDVAKTLGEEAVLKMNQSFAKCLSLVYPPIQYPPHCRFNPVQQDAADTAEIEAKLEDFFLYAKQIELLLMKKKSQIDKEEPLPSENADVLPKRHELEHEIALLEIELNEKNDLIEKYGEVIRGWEGKFKRLGNRLNPDRE
jgi:hypothetical protein